MASMRSPSRRNERIVRLPDETAGSMVWRYASANRLGVAEVCARILRLDYRHARGDLDALLPERFQRQTCALLQLSSARLSTTRIPGSILRSIAHPIRVCPACLSDSKHGRRFWRTILAEACPTHGCLLLESCPNCGTPLRLQQGFFGMTPLLWLETWPTCTNCLQAIRWTPIPAPPVLVTVSGQWENALRDHPHRNLRNLDFLCLSARIARWFETDPHYIAARYCGVGNHQAAISAQHATALVVAKLRGASLSRIIFHAALRIPFDSSQLAKEMVV